MKKFLAAAFIGLVAGLIVMRLSRRRPSAAADGEGEDTGTGA